jgi:hypothetical protein
MAPAALASSGQPRQMWLRRTPMRTRSGGGTAFGSSSQRFDGRVKIVDWSATSEAMLTAPQSKSGATDDPDQRPRRATALDDPLHHGEAGLPAHSFEARQARTTHTGGLCRLRTPWGAQGSRAGQKHDGSNTSAHEQRMAPDADFRALWLQGHMHAKLRDLDTPRLEMSDRRQLHSGGVTAWDSRSPTRAHPDASRKHKRNADRARPATEAGNGPAGCRSAARTGDQEGAIPGYVREVHVKTGADKSRHAHIGDNESAPASPTSLTDCFNEGNFMPVYELVSDEQTQAEAEDKWGLSPTSPVSRQLADQRSHSMAESRRAFLTPKRQILSDSIAVEECSPCSKLTKVFFYFIGDSETDHHAFDSAHLQSLLDRSVEQSAAPVQQEVASWGGLLLRSATECTIFHQYSRLKKTASSALPLPRVHGWILLAQVSMHKRKRPSSLVHEEIVMNIQRRLT